MGATNSTGVESFDHENVAGLPEYHAARVALDDLAHAIQRADQPVPQERWLEIVRQMAASLAYADCCPGCRRSGNLDPRWPYQATVGDGSVQGEYQCPACERRWNCGWAINVDLSLG